MRRGWLLLGWPGCPKAAPRPRRVGSRGGGCAGLRDAPAAGWRGHSGAAVVREKTEVIDRRPAPPCPARPSNGCCLFLEGRRRRATAGVCRNKVPPQGPARPPRPSGSSLNKYLLSAASIYCALLAALYGSRCRNLLNKLCIEFFFSLKENTGLGKWFLCFSGTFNQLLLPSKRKISATLLTISKVKVLDQSLSAVLGLSDQVLSAHARSPLLSHRPLTLSCISRTIPLPLTLTVPPSSLPSLLE